MLQNDKLAKLLEIANEDNVSSKQLTALLAPIVGAVQKAMTDMRAVAQANKDIVVQTKAILESTVAELNKEADRRGFQLESDTTRVLKKVEAALATIEGIEVEDGQPGLQGLQGNPGNDGSPDSGDDIVDKINNLPTDDPDCQIDATHIKNLPVAIQQGMKLHGGFRNLSVFDESTILTKAARAIKFVGSGVTATVGSDGVITVTINGGGGVGGTVALENLTGSGTGRTATQTPVFGIVDEQLVVNGNGYSLSGLNITLDNGTSSPFHSFYNSGATVIALEAHTVSGTTQTFTNTPVGIIASGQLLTNGDGYTLSGLNATFDNAPGTVYAIYNVNSTGLALEGTATGAYNGSNKIFTTAHTPVFMAVEGEGFVNGDGYSLSSLTETMDNAPVSAATTHSFFNQ